MKVSKPDKRTENKWLKDWLDTSMVRDPIKVFANAMELKLKANDHKGGWDESQCTLQYLHTRLLDEQEEYLKTCKPEELLDIANFAMMAWHREHSTGMYK